MKETKFVRFPNESDHVEMLIDMDEFRVIHAYEFEIFGRYKGMYIFIKK